MTENIQIIKDTETIIDEAALLCEKNYSHEEIISVMKTENDVEKQICMLKLAELKNQQEAELLVFQLTGHHGLIREAAAIKISEFIESEKYIEYFLTSEILHSFLLAVNDINPNICRMICSVLQKLFVNAQDKKEEFLIALYERFEVIFEELEKLKRSNWYTKKLFQLYWGLEALAVLSPFPCESLESVLKQSSVIKDYTIREKTAYVLSRLKSTTPAIEEIKEQLKSDDNFYVKRYAKEF